MEKRIGTVIIGIENREAAPSVNEIISKHSDIVIGRLGLPRHEGMSLINLVVEGTTDEIGSLTGQLGKLDGIEVKSAVLKK
jgi:putative iron-only hydrogenase system regulator